MIVTDTASELLAVATLAGLAAWATASLFLHVSALRGLFAVMALAIALDVVTRRLAEQSPGSVTRAPRGGAPDRRPWLVAAGVLFGRHPLAPSVSPKKSWEGLAGSVAACVLIGVLLVAFASTVVRYALARLRALRA